MTNSSFITFDSFKNVVDSLFSSYFEVVSKRSIEPDLTYENTIFKIDSKHLLELCQKEALSVFSNC